MTSNPMRSIFAFCAIAAVAGTHAFAQVTAPSAPANPGTIVGMVRNPDRTPIAGATVTATRLDNHSIRATMSTSDGIYSFADLTPGTYAVAAEAEGYSRTNVPTVEVTSGKATTTHLAMTASSAAPVQVTKSMPPAAPSGTNNSANAFVKTWLKGEGQTLGDLLKPDPRPATSNSATDSKQIASLNTPPATAFDKPSPDVPAPTPVPQTVQAPPAGGPPAAAAPPTTPAPVDTQTPFADHDWTWLNGNPRNKDTAFDSKFFTPEIRADLTYTVLSLSLGGGGGGGELLITIYIYIYI